MANQTADMPIENVSIASLLVMQTMAKDATEKAKAATTAVATEIARRYADSVFHSLNQSQKSHGTVSLPLQDGITLKGEIKRTVKWDSEKLQAVAQTLPWERVAAIFKIEFSVPEAIYKGIAALSPELRNKIDAARTTKLAPATASLVKDA